MPSSGDLLADRRYRYAEAALAEGDFPAAADLARQTLELVPGFAAAWFLLGRALSQAEATGEEAAAAFRKALALDPEDTLGAGIRLAELGRLDPHQAMSPGYVRALFDEYARRFDRHLTRSLGYRGPELLHEAVRRACSLRLKPFRFATLYDLGCGTGLVARAFAQNAMALHGVDLSPNMVAAARRTRLYRDLATGDLLGWLRDQAAGSADLVIAADVFVYLANLGCVFGETARVLARDGLFAFTVQAHEGPGVALGSDARYAHSEPYLRELAAHHRFAVVLFEPVSTRQDRGSDVPGFLTVMAAPNGPG
jgi:predicted TPR repeat methyltransferase